MKTLYLDLFSGISGDMLVGALLDLGADFTRLERDLAGLGVSGYHLHAARGLRGGISGIKFDVHLEAAGGHAHGPGQAHNSPHDDGAGTATEHEPHPGHETARDFAAIRDLLAASALSPWVKATATAVFRRLAEAEGRIHHQPPERVHFHEVGAVDSIVDIVGACLALEQLGRPRVLASAVVEGTGWVKCAHGRFPVPTPATVALLAARGVTLNQCAEPHELVTPTGAALLAELVESFGPLSEFRVERVGYGLGTRELQSRPNVLRVLLGETASTAAPHDWETDTVAVLETNLDDVSPEILAHTAARALEAGALDAFHTPVQMKKGRPGTLFTVLCAEAEADRLTELLLVETGALGVRRTRAERRKLRRDFLTVPTPFGAVTVKRGWLDGRVVHVAPEYEACRQAAATAGVPVKQVYEAALAAARTPGSALSDRSD
jgi:uncharacterized protein (TIGR00299 family) protein